MLLLDDLHAADAPSLLFLHFVAPVSPGRILLVGAYREVDGAARTAPRQLAELAREPVTRDALDGLTGLARAIVEVTGSPPADLVAAGHAETAGNPLFLAEVGAPARQRGPGFVDPAQSVRETIGASPAPPVRETATRC